MRHTIAIPFAKKFSAYLSTPEDKAKHPGLIVIHEVWGLNAHIKDVADRFAKKGYVVVAPDLLSHTGITEQVDQTILAEIRNPKTRDEAQKKLRAAMVPIMVPEFAEETVAKLKACVDYLLSRADVTGNVAVVGFCFGGTYSYALAAADKRIQGAVPFYGQPPAPFEKVKQINCPVLAFYGKQDVHLVGGLPDLEQKMKEYGKDFTYTVYPHTGHAFFNDTNPTTYNKEAANDSWQKALQFLSRVLS